MNDREELLAWIKERMRQKGGNGPSSFYQVIQEDPLLLKDLFQTFSDHRIVDVMLDEEQQGYEHIGVWIRKRGDSLPTYAEVYTAENSQYEAVSPKVHMNYRNSHISHKFDGEI